MKKPFLSIIIPSYNSAHTLGDLFDSIFSSKYRNYEVILVDDSSADKTREVVKKHKQVRYFLIKNLGPGGARNFGAKKAKGDILVFFDSDVVLFPNTLKRIARAFTNKKTMAITGIWDKSQKSADFFPKYKALRDWCYWFFEDAGGDYSHVFSPRVSAVRKKVFWQFGGFDDAEKGVNALEEFGFTYRLTEKYEIKFVPEIKVYHEFGDFWSMMKKFFKRSFKYAKVFLQYRKFNRNGYTPSEGIAGLMAIFAFMSVFLSLWFLEMLYLGGLFFIIHLYLERKFLKFVLKEEGFIFTLKSIFAGFIVYFVVYTAAGIAVLHSLITKINS